MADLERWEVKALCMFGLFASMSIFVLLPIRVSKTVEKQGKRGVFIISVLSCFGGGVFFGAYLTHLSPEVRATLEEAWLIPQGIYYPIPEALAGFGFFLILFLEKAILFGRERSEKKRSKNKNGKLSDDAQYNDQHLPYEVNVKITGASFQKTTEENDLTMGHNAVGRFYPDEESRSRSSSMKKSEEAKAGMSNRGYMVDPEAGKYTTNQMKVTEFKDNGSTSSRDLVEAEEDDAAKTRSIIFVIALSLDCIFEGLALGLMDTTLDVLNLFVAIISHEFIMSFCIGMELVKHYPTKKVVWAGLLYAFTPVFGAIIGTAILESQDGLENQTTVDIVSGVLSAISAGTFIYCSFIGILSEELTHDNGFWKALATLLGFGLMAAMAAIPEDSLGSEEGAMTTAVMATTASDFMLG